MLTTLVIGLREGLEAALIVGIIAAFLRRNGKSLVPMAIGVAAAVLISLGVGVGLRVVEKSLPQSAQEAMETVIGAVAVVFVTGMILWMSTHARGLKRELEASASDALGAGSTRALVAMAFLAVLKEGFETAVFLLATFTAATNSALAAVGASLGVLIAVGIGIGIYRGGIRLNLGRFFSVTGVFLLLVAAGLVVTTLGTAHEAGWLNAGQQRVADLRWLSPPGSVRGALLTGVLGIPAAPALIQVIGWFSFLVPMALYLFWPRSHRPSARAGVLIRTGVAAALGVTAVVLLVTVRPVGLGALGQANLLDSSGGRAGSASVSDGTLQLTTGDETRRIALGSGVAGNHAGVADAVLVERTLPGPSGLPATVSADQLLSLNGGRLPVGVNPAQAPGPYSARWSYSGSQQVWTVDGQLLELTQQSSLALTLSGGGLTTSRTVSLDALPADSQGSSASLASLTTDPGYVSAAADAVRAAQAGAVEHRFWGRTLPVVLGIVALVLLLAAGRARRRLRLTSTPSTSHATSPATTSSPAAGTGSPQQVPTDPKPATGPPVLSGTATRSS